MPDNSDNVQQRSIDTLLVDLATMASSRTVPGDAGEDRAGLRSKVGVDNEAVSSELIVATYELALNVAAQTDVAAMLRTLVDGVCEVFGASSAALVIEGRAGTDAAVLLSGTPLVGAADQWSTDRECALSGTPMPDAPILIPDVMAASVRHIPGASVMGVPLWSSSCQVGYLYLIDDEDVRVFSEQHLALLERLAQHVTVAVERGRAETGPALGQDQIEAQLSQLRTIMDTLPAGVLVLVPPDGRVELANETALSTILGDQREGDGTLRAYRDFRWLRADGTELPRIQHPGMLALKGEPIGNRALNLQVKDGRVVPVRVQSTPIYDHDGSVARAVVLFLDVSRERAAEQIKDDFLSLISHEFRTPLTAIHGGALLLSQQAEAMDDEMRQELLQDIGEESLRLDRMLGNLLSVSEIMAGRFQASTEPILVAPLVQPMMEEFRQKTVDHTFALDVEPDVPPAEGSPELLLQILRNLYENAVKYSPGGGEIRTVIRRQGDTVSIAVIDNGLGIAAEHVPHVFERFRRPGAEPTVRGMGLGLYLSRLLVDAQGGRIQASSAGPGKGATFEVELPTVSDWEREHEPDGDDRAEL